MVHPHVRHLHHRQDTALPTAQGLDSATVAEVPQATANSFVFDTDAAKTAGVNTNVVNFSASPTGTFTDTPAPSTTDNSADTVASPSASAATVSASSEISMGTVIGACLGALAGAAAIILIGLWLYKRGNKPRPRSPYKGPDKERAWGKLDDDEDKWEGKEGKYQQKGVISVGPMEKLTMFKKSTPSVRTAYTTTQDHDQEPLPSVAHFTHPFAQYHPDLAKELAEDDAVEPPRRPFLARVDPVAPISISWDGDTVGRDSFLSLSSNPAMSPGTGMAIPTPQLTSSEPHYWESAEVEVMHYDDNGDALPRGRTSVVVESQPAEPRRKSANNPFFGSRMSTHSTHSRSRSQSRSRTPSISSPSKSSHTDPASVPMPTPPPAALTREEKGKYRAATPPSPTSSMAPSTIRGHDNPFSDPVLPFKPDHSSQSSHDRALQSLIAALGPSHNAADVEERLRVASMNPSVVSESAYTETEYGDDATLHQSWPVPPSRP
ncbi:hypothetical protein C8R44DRAFT_733725 [Mycena epipterygia]|nr:hypothetical protein C8R44DRAFT_733725 [Mycena epipterygia]